MELKFKDNLDYATVLGYKVHSSPMPFINVVLKTNKSLIKKRSVNFGIKWLVQTV